MSENTDRRILAAIQPVDAVLHLPLADRVHIDAPGIRLVYNLHGEAVLMEAPRLHLYSYSFDPPGAPPVESLDLDIELRDATLRYLPRRLQLELPKDPDPLHAGQPNSVFVAVEAEMYPAPASPILGTWAVVRAAVQERNTRQRLPWTLIQARSGNAVVGQGLSDARGEVLIAVPGIPFFMPGGGGGATVTREITVTFRAFFDAAHLSRLPPEGLPLGSANPNQSYLPDPAFLLTLPARTVRVLALRPGGGAPANNAKLASGSQLLADLLVTLP
jgi:hypothetical protein